MTFDTKAYHRDKKAKLKALGICANCEKTNARPGNVCCNRCLARKRENTMARSHPGYTIWFKKTLRKQNLRCAICLGFMKRANVDHCHETGKRRGLLCSGCNTAIGKLKDDPEVLRRAADYIESYQNNPQK